MTELSKQEILLETGTNEMEIIEFYLATQSFGLNVQKLKEIISYDEEVITVVPGSSPGMLGTLLLRGSTIPLIDLKSHLVLKEADLDEDVRRVVLICEFNNRVNGFKVDGVNMIHRVSWSDVQPMAPFIDQYQPRFTGSINIEGREILIVDLEHIIAEFDPEADLDFEAELHAGQMLEKVPHRRQKMKLMLAEDSSLIRAGIARVLNGAGYCDLITFIDGEDCYKKILQLKKAAQEANESVLKYLNLLITDIEMPKMDGLTLCKKIKDDPVLREVKVILFSSLINEQMAVKCDSVGADGYATKPQIPYLVQMMDKHLGIAGADVS
ncbi:MAG: chemotaxis protein CheV [Desulfuromonadales bacterium]|nr:chemotaxis protein CheV [Desulfuromonadales bacterium]